MGSTALVCSFPPTAMPLAEFYAATLKARHRPKTIDCFRTSLNHHARVLGRPANIADLTAEAILATLQSLARTGRSPKQVARVRQDLVALANRAAAMNLVHAPAVPSINETNVIVPWSLFELNQIFGSARTMPGAIEGIPAKRWWPALLLTALDTGASIRNLLDCRFDAYLRLRGFLAAGAYLYALRPMTIEALDWIARSPRAMLFPWPLDGNASSAILHMLLRAYKTLLWRAGLPYVPTNLFNRLQVTAQQHPGAIEAVNLQLPFEPRQGKLSFPRARSAGRLDGRAAQPRVDRAGRGASETPGVSVAPQTRPGKLYIIAINSPRTLQRFLEEVYIPLRLANARQSSIQGCRTCVRRVECFASCQVTLDALSDQFVESLMSWQLRCGRSPATANRTRATILALWRYAYRKRYLHTQPRDVEKLRLDKRLPNCWSVDELGRILQACAETQGDVCGVPAGQWWVCLVLLMYYTGLRANAVFHLTREHLDVKQASLLVPAAIQKQRSEQVFRLPGDLLARLLASGVEDRHVLLPSQEKHTVRKRYREILQRAGLPYGSRHLFHKLRRTSATYLAAAAGEEAAKQHLGHADISTTRRYIDPAKLTGPQACDLLPRPAWPEPAALLDVKPLAHLPADHA